MEERLIVIAVICCIIFLFLYFIALEFKDIAEMKGFPESKYFWYSFLFPLGGYLLVIALPDRNQGKETEANPSEEQTANVGSDELPGL